MDGELRRSISIPTVFLRDVSTQEFGAARLQMMNESDFIKFIMEGDHIAREIKINKCSDFYPKTKKNSIQMFVDGNEYLIEFVHTFEFQRAISFVYENIKFVRTAVYSRRTSLNTEYKYLAYVSLQEYIYLDYWKVNCYKKAFDSCCDIFKDKVIVDLSSNSGIMSMFALRAGARLVYAVGVNPTNDIMKVLLRVNGEEHKVKFFSGKIKEIELPEKVDVIVAEPCDVMLFNQRVLKNYFLARKWLKPGGVMFPSGCNLHIVPFMDDALFIELYATTSFYDVEQSPYYFNAFRITHFNQPIIMPFDENICLSESVPYAIDFYKDNEIDLRNIVLPVRFNINKLAAVHGLAFWCEPSFLGSQESASLPTASSESVNKWCQVRCLIKNPPIVKPGQHLVGTVILSLKKNGIFDIFMDLAVDGVEDIRCWNNLELNNPYFPSSKPDVDTENIEMTPPKTANLTSENRREENENLSYMSGDSPIELEGHIQKEILNFRFGHRKSLNESEPSEQQKKNALSFGFRIG